MSVYDDLRQKYRPTHIKALLIAESPPPPATIGGSRHFYRTDKLRVGDRLFVNTIKALYPDAANMAEAKLERDKEKWLRKFQADGWFMIEALQESLAHEVTKPQRQALIKQNLPRLIERVGELAGRDTKIILIKSNVFVVAAEPLSKAGFRVLNTALLDYPGQFNQADYRKKLATLALLV